MRALSSEYRQFRTAIYQLKRKYPTSVVLKVEDDDPHIDLSPTGTGDILESTIDVTIERAILLPKTEKFIKLPGVDIPSTLPVSVRQLLIDFGDVPRGIDLRKSSFKVLYESELWDVVKVELVENLAWQIWLQEVEGSRA